MTVVLAFFEVTSHTFICIYFVPMLEYLFESFVQPLSILVLLHNQMFCSCDAGVCVKPLARKRLRELTQSVTSSYISKMSQNYHMLSF